MLFDSSLTSNIVLNAGASDDGPTATGWCMAEQHERERQQRVRDIKALVHYDNIVQTFGHALTQNSKPAKRCENSLSLPYLQRSRGA